MPASVDLIAQRGPILVTAAALGLWYALLFGLQSRTKYRLKAEYAARGEVFDRYLGQDRRMLAADRAVANTQEQLLPFLVALWLHAIFVSPAHATGLGAAWVLLRASYPLLLGRELAGTQSKRVFFVTGPCYLIIATLLGRVVLAALGA
jgi:hypothetical protein